MLISEVLTFYSRNKQIPLTWPIIFGEGLGVEIYLYFLTLTLPTCIHGLGNNRFRQTPTWGEMLRMGGLRLRSHTEH